MTTSPTTEPDAVARAASAVSEELYRGAGGDAVRQRTVPEAIHRHLRLLDVHPGMRVMEIGTGSGLSAALLSELVGPIGEVVSVDLDRDLAARAERLHDRAGCGNVVSVAADGVAGHSRRAPYDRVIAWATPPVIPDAWLAQTKSGGVVVQPIRPAPMTYSTVMARFTVDACGEPAQASLHRGSYVRMDSPGREAFESDDSDAEHLRDGDRYPHFVSAPWLRDSDGATAASVLAALLRARRIAPGGLEWPTTEHLKAWLIARDPHGLIMAGLNTLTGIGIAGRDHIAVITIFPECHIHADTAESTELKTLRALLAEWDEAGRPAMDVLRTEPVRTTGGWRVRAFA